MIIVGSNEPIIFMRGNLVHSVFFLRYTARCFFLTYFAGSYLSSFYCIYGLCAWAS